MALTELSLPVDIPWKRMGVSADMIDTHAGDLQFPEKWRSSIAAFYHEPTDLPPEYCDRRITYIKLAVTITNFQIGTDDVTVLDELRKSWGQFYAWKNFDSSVTRSYPCYGALLQVSVLPNPRQGVATHDFPYISGFQPRKREMYEVVTESGEVASQSANKLNVLKGTTTTDTQEDYDLDLGGGGGSMLFGLASWNSGQKQEGTVNRYQKQDQDVRTTDASRDKRESHASSTSINQLYTLLQGYHLGTNRAMFFMQPRPHIQDSQFTFIRGLRRLEGVQEFFLIVDRPATVPGICVEVALETAHLHAWRSFRPRIVPASDLLVPHNLQHTASALGLDINDYPYERSLVEAWNAHHPWVRAAVGESELAGESHYSAELEYAFSSGILTQDDWSRMASLVGHVPEIGVEDVALIFDEYEAQSGTIFVTGRRLCSCVTPARPDGDDEGGCEESTDDHVSGCSTWPSVVYTRDLVATFERMGRETYALAQNAVVKGINETLFASLAHMDRQPYDRMRFIDTDFVLDELAQVVRLARHAGVRDQDARETPLKALVDRGLAIDRLTDIGELDTEAIAGSLGTTDAEAREVRREALVGALHSLEPGTVPREHDRLNPVRERYARQFPADLRESLAASARIHVGPPDRGDVGDAVRRPPSPDEGSRRTPR
jgi:hypothetical protein